MNHGFVIVTKNQSIKCINTVMSIYSEYKNPVIVVLDNNSNEKSYNILKKNSSKFSLIKRNTTAKCRVLYNTGFKFLEENYNLDFIHIVKNGVIIKDAKDINNYNPDSFYIMGPCVNRKKRFNKKILDSDYLIFSSSYFKTINNIYHDNHEEITMFYVLTRLSKSNLIIYNEKMKILVEKETNYLLDTINLMKKRYNVFSELSEYNNNEIRDIFLKENYTLEEK